MPPSNRNSLQDLKYPPVRVNHSLTKLDLDTLMMRSTTRRQSEEPGSSLDESTYELLGDSLLETSDDEAHTESIASTNGPTPDDTSDFSDDDDDDDDDDYGTVNRDMYESIDAYRPTPSEQYSNVRSVASGEESTLTETPAHLEGSESWMIRLDEQPTETPQVVLGRKVIKSLPDQTSELPQVLTQYGSAQVRLVVRAALSQRSVPTPDSYKILYIGMPEKWLEDIVTSQVGSALTASPSISKSVMVRGQMEPYGPVIHVYRCTEIHTFAEREKKSHVLIILDDGQQLKFGPGFDSHSSGRPDLVVFCHPSISSTVADIQEFAAASKVFSREKIPCIDLAQARPYGEGEQAYDSTSLRVCMEGRDDANAEYDLKEVLPLDYYTFSQLEPSQLNRHLALISPHLLAAQDAKDNWKQRASWTGGTFNAFAKLRPQWSSMKMLVPLVLFFVVVPALLQGTAYAPVLFQRSSVSEVESSFSTQTPTLSSPTALTASTSQTIVPSASVASERLALRDLTLVPSQAKPPKRRPGKKDGKVGGFNIQKTGNHQFILSPSKDFSQCRRKPQLQIIISRDSQVVPARYNRTIDGEYIVDLGEEYALGSFNVSITTHSKPLLRQSFEIVLGHDRSKLAQFLNTATANLIDTQNKLRNLSTTAVHRMRASLADLEAATLQWAGERRGSSEEAAERLRNAQRAVQHQVAVGTELLKHASGATWNGVRQLTAPIRTSSPMLRARMNALRLRCNMEIAAGLSGKNADEVLSWACSKVLPKSSEGLSAEPL